MVFQNYALYPHMTVAENKLRVETRANIANLQARLGTTTIYVTHDQVEAMTMGHRVAVLKDARLQQVDAPRNLYEHPDNVFVAEFIGSPAMNLRTAKLDGEGALLGGGVLPLPREAVAAARSDGLGEVTIGLRPESASLSPAGSPGAIDLTVRLVEGLGADAYVYGELAGDTNGEKPWVVRCDGRAVPHLGDHVGVAVDAGTAHVFNARTGLRLTA
jgi:multiple sugar transport system ATP-binding protein